MLRFCVDRHGCAVVRLRQAGGTRAEGRIASAPSCRASHLPPAAADTRPAIVCFGDSITAGFGLDTGQSFPDLAAAGPGPARPQVPRRQSRRERRHHAGRPRARVHGPRLKSLAIVLLELGGNDGLRGIPLAITQANLAQMIEAFQGGGARVVLAGMSLPPNYGSAFIQKFEAMYKDLAAKYRVTLIPFLYGRRGRHNEFMQRDGIHPNAAGARKMEALVMKTLAPLLSKVEVAQPHSGRATAASCLGAPIEEQLPLRPLDLQRLSLLRRTLTCWRAASQ